MIESAVHRPSRAAKRRHEQNHFHRGKGRKAFHPLAQPRHQRWACRSPIIQKEGDIRSQSDRERSQLFPRHAQAEQLVHANQRAGRIG